MGVYFTRRYTNHESIERVYHKIEEVKEDLQNDLYDFNSVDLETLDTGLYDFVVFYSDWDDPIIIQRRYIENHER